MTREETIEELKKGRIRRDIKAFDDALGVAIKALEQEPCEDAISRQVVLDLIEHYNSDGLGSVFFGYKQGVKFADAVNKLPSVTIQPKTGHWIYTLEDWNKWECSECGFTKRTDVHVKIGYKFCPNCGAKMEKESEEFDNLDKMLEKLWNDTESEVQE